MSEFKTFKGIFQKNFKELTKDASHLFEVELNLDDLWTLYLDSFLPEDNPIFRERREYDCSCCRQFIRNIGNVVVIKDNQVKTIWDFDAESTTFQPVVNALDTFVKSHVISDVFVTKFKKIGTDKNFEQLANDEVIEWQHFYLELPDKFVDKTNRSEGEIRGGFRSTKDVFKGSLDKINEDSLLTILELIASNTLYKGEEWKFALTEFLKYKKEYDKLETTEEKELYTWEQSVNISDVVAKIKNHSIGTLLENISEGMNLDTAVTKYEKIVAPENYKRPKAIYTQKMLEEAKKTIQDLGYMDSLSGRRFARIDDISVNNILFVNKDSAKRISGGLDVFEEMSKGIPLNPKKFSKVTEITIDDFIANVLPTAREIEVFLENKHSSNMVSLIAPEIKDSKTMFKWDNNFSWAYSGNITDSSMKERVRELGGRVDGVLRFTHTWNYDGQNQSLMDLHVFMPNSGYKKTEGTVEIHDNYPSGRRVGWNKRNDISSGGIQDVDFVEAPGKNIPVENITFPNIDKMPEGVYTFKIHNWNLRQTTRSGFKAEIEFNNTIYSFECDRPLKHKEWITLAEVTLKDGKFTIKEIFPSTTSSKEIWNLKTNQFVPVSVVMYSPNYWNLQQGIGNRHFIFMLKDCINPESPNPFFNEFLNQELNQHRKVFEALASKMAVEDSELQLSGLGFSSTKRSELTVKVKGNTERMLKIKF